MPLHQSDYVKCVQKLCKPLTKMHASAEQIGEAARMRGSCSGKDRRTLNFIVHSPNPEKKYGPNEFADNAKYDPHVTDVLREIALKRHLQTDNLELIEIVHELRDLVRSMRLDHKDSTVVAERMLKILDEFHKKT